MIHPWEFGIRKATGILGEKFEQKIRNPHGNGLSYLLAVDWSNDSYAQYGLEYVGTEGQIYSFNYRNFDSDFEFELELSRAFSLNDNY